MKVRVSLPEEDLHFLDSYAEAQGLGSRSAVLHKAIRLLRAADLGPAYEDAWQDWAEDGQEAGWDRSSGDGLT